jgi:hypothetical protein
MASVYMEQYSMQDTPQEILQWVMDSGSRLVWAADDKTKPPVGDYILRWHQSLRRVTVYRMLDNGGLELIYIHADTPGCCKVPSKPRPFNEVIGTPHVYYPIVESEMVRDEINK